MNEGDVDYITSTEQENKQLRLRINKQEEEFKDRLDEQKKHSHIAYDSIGREAKSLSEELNNAYNTIDTLSKALSDAASKIVSLREELKDTYRKAP